VRGAAPPTDLRSGSSLVQFSRTADGHALSLVDAAAANKVPPGHRAPAGVSNGALSHGGAAPAGAAHGVRY
jgi:hypothetical protein